MRSKRVLSGSNAERSGHRSQKRAQIAPGPSDDIDGRRYGVTVNDSGTETTGFAGSLLCTQTLPV